MEDILLRSLAEHESALKNGAYTAEELLDAYLKQIDRNEREIGAFLTLDRDGARAAACASDHRRRKGIPLAALDGIPFAVKDNFCTQGVRTTCASRMLESYIPPYDATVVERLRAQGCALVGKLNMDEFGMGSSTEHSALGITRNPHDPTRVAGGSSGGAAAAVAAAEIPFALASDTGGSVRQPAAFCGVIGLKPTYGALPRYGLVAFASSFDTVGVITRSAGDCARVFGALVGRDGRDATSLPHPYCEKNLEHDIPDPCRLGIADSDFGSDSSAYAVDAAASVLKKAGVSLRTISLPDAQQALAAYYIISCAEASANLARFDGVRYGSRSACSESLTALYENSRADGFGDEVKRRILFGTHVLSAGNRASLYLRACSTREQIRRQMLAQFEKCDVMMLPVAPTTAFRFGERQTPARMYASDVCTVYASIAGFPAISVPFGRDGDGLPRAVQLIAPPMEEGRLLSLAKKLEEVAV